MYIYHDTIYHYTIYYTYIDISLHLDPIAQLLLNQLHGSQLRDITLW